jgi:hypothetical protein
MSTAVEAVHQVTSEAIQRSESNANPDFMTFALESVRVAATLKKEITIDDVREVNESYPNAPKTHNNSAFGPVILRAVEKGIITRKEGAAVKSRRPSSHGRLLRVFTSNIYQIEAATPILNIN